MIGVVVFALGLHQMFESIDHGDTLDNGVMVTGYVIMRVALVFLWLQVARHDPERAPAARTYAIAVGIAQVGWIAFVFLDLPVATTFACFTVLLAIELLGPFLAERKAPTPVARAPHRRALRPADDHHARRGHHRHDRRAQRARPRRGGLDDRRRAAHRRRRRPVLRLLVGVLRDPLGRADRPPSARGFIFGYGHLVIFGSLAAMGAGLHVAAYRLEGEAKIGDVATVLSVAIPVAVFLLALYALYSLMFRDARRLPPAPARGHGRGAGARDRAGRGGREHGGLPARAHARAGVTVVGYETLGHRHMRGRARPALAVRHGRRARRRWDSVRDRCRR